MSNEEIQQIDQQYQPSRSVQFRFQNISQVNVLSKVDLLDEDQIEMIVNWSQDFQALDDSTNEREKGLIRELSMLISDVFIILLNLVLEI